MCTYDEIKKANETIKTTDIKGKEYAEVPQRIKAFRMVYPEGSIITEMLSNENGMCIFRATVQNDRGITLGTGTAYEREDRTFINKTSYIENCETSAVGRALGMSGFGIDTSVASAEEVQNAMANQTKAGAAKIAEDAKANVLKNLSMDQSQRRIPKDAVPDINAEIGYPEPQQSEVNPAPFLTNDGEPKASPKQVEILREKYIGNNYKKLCYANGVSRVEDIPAKKAAELIEKLMAREGK